MNFYRVVRLMGYTNIAIIKPCVCLLQTDLEKANEAASATDRFWNYGLQLAYTSPTGVKRPWASIRSTVRANSHPYPLCGCRFV